MLQSWACSLHCHALATDRSASAWHRYTHTTVPKQVTLQHRRNTSTRPSSELEFWMNMWLREAMQHIETCAEVLQLQNGCIT